MAFDLEAVATRRSNTLMTKKAIVCSWKSFPSLCHGQVSYKICMYHKKSNERYGILLLVYLWYMRTYKRTIPSHFEINGEFEIFFAWEIISSSTQSRHFKFLFIIACTYFKFIQYKRMCVQWMKLKIYIPRSYLCIASYHT